MNTIKFEEDKIITNINGIKQIWNLKDIESNQYITYKNRNWFLKID